MSYIKPNSDFKLSKPAKTMIALMGGKTKEQRDGWKRAFIQSELAEKAARNAKYRENKGDIE
jgi:hypothetical protein